MKNTYIHDIPGRLRVRAESIRHDEAAAAAVRDLFAGTPSVTSVKTNLLAGSVTVTYDPNELTSAAILGLLHDHGYLDVETRASGRGTVPQQSSVAGAMLTQALVWKVGRMALEWSVERAVSAAVAALL